MADIVHISEAFNLALHALLALAAQPNARCRTPDLAKKFGASSAHLAKVFQRLEQQGLVQGLRGPRGGFNLAVSPDSVSLLRIFEIIEGPWRKVTCLLKHPVCDGTQCALGPLINQISLDAYSYLAGTTLAALVPKDNSYSTGCATTTSRNKRQNPRRRGP